MYLFVSFADGAVMPSWFDLHEIPITAVSYAYFPPQKSTLFYPSCGLTFGGIFL